MISFLCLFYFRFYESFEYWFVSESSLSIWIANWFLCFESGGSGDDWFESWTTIISLTASSFVTSFIFLGAFSYSASFACSSSACDFCNFSSFFFCEAFVCSCIDRSSSLLIYSPTTRDFRLLLPTPAFSSTISTGFPTHALWCSLDPDELTWAARPEARLGLEFVFVVGFASFWCSGIAMLAFDPSKDEFYFEWSAVRILFSTSYWYWDDFSFDYKDPAADPSRLCFPYLPAIRLLSLLLCSRALGGGSLDAPLRILPASMSTRHGFTSSGCFSGSGGISYCWRSKSAAKSNWSTASTNFLCSCFWWSTTLLNWVPVHIACKQLNI